MPTALRRHIRTAGRRIGPAALCVLLATAGCLPDPPRQAGQLPHRQGWGPAEQAHRIDGPVTEPDQARLELVSPAARVTVRAVALPGPLYRVTTPPDSGLAPVVRHTAAGVRVGLRPTGRDGPDTVDIEVNRRVRWHIRLAAGAGEQHLDLGNAALDGLDLAGAAGLVRVRLPAPSGTVPVRLTGGVGHAELHVPAEVPMRVALARGAALVRTPYGRRAAVPAGTVLTTPVWGAATDRYQVMIGAGMASLVVARPAGAPRR